MGMRSMNALVLMASQVIPEQVAKRLQGIGQLFEVPEGVLWLWETNISPLFTRYGVTDLMEEVDILGWLLTLPRGEFKLYRCGEELGSLGEWDNNPFSKALHAEYSSVVDQYRQEVLEATPDEEGRMWAKSTPPHQGWYLANPTRTGLSWRFWDGRYWSETGQRGMTAAEAAVSASRRDCKQVQTMMWWSDFWPEGLVLNRSAPPPAEQKSPETLDEVNELLSSTHQGLIQLILKAAKILGEVSFKTAYADGMWGVIVDSKGQVRLGGYAVEHYPAGALLEELPLWALAHLAEELQRIVKGKGL